MSDLGARISQQEIALREQQAATAADAATAATDRVRIEQEFGDALVDTAAHLTSLRVPLDSKTPFFLELRPGLRRNRVHRVDGWSLWLDEVPLWIEREARWWASSHPRKGRWFENHAILAAPTPVVTTAQPTSALPQASVPSGLLGVHGHWIDVEDVGNVPTIPVKRRGPEDPRLVLERVVMLGYRNEDRRSDDLLDSLARAIIQIRDERT